LNSKIFWPMPDKFWEYTEELKKKNEPFATAVVVWREAPSSSRVGDKAVIDKYGEIFGWVGGGCVNGILIKEAEDAMKSAKPRLVKIGKSILSSKEEGVMQYQMTCLSEGSVEIFIEPVMPTPHLVVIGKSPIARSLVKLAGASGYRITAVAQDANLQTFEKVDQLITEISLANVVTTHRSFIIVATQGEFDEKALEESLRKKSAYVGFVASKKKMASMAAYLADAGFDETVIGGIRSPAGIDINARTPEEVAISILAEIIQVQNRSRNITSFEQFDVMKEKTVTPPAKYYMNPVCGVPVDVNNPKHIIEYNGEKIYFCCDGCKIKFEADPQKYMSQSMEQ
jgi:xanthine dehydrogenase accessory factor